MKKEGGEMKGVAHVLSVKPNRHPSTIGSRGGAHGRAIRPARAVKPAAACEEGTQRRRKKKRDKNPEGESAHELHSTYKRR